MFIEFVELCKKLYKLDSTNEKVKLIVAYLKGLNEIERSYSVYLLTNRSIRRVLSSSNFKKLTLDTLKMEDWLFSEAYKELKDLPLVVGLLIYKDTSYSSLKLIEIIESICSLRPLEKESFVKELWENLSRDEIVIFNRLVLGLKIIDETDSTLKAISFIEGVDENLLRYNNSRIGAKVEIKNLYSLLIQNSIKVYPSLKVPSILKDSISNLGKSQEWSYEITHKRKYHIVKGDSVYLLDESYTIIEDSKIVEQVKSIDASFTAEIYIDTTLDGSSSFVFTDIFECNGVELIDLHHTKRRAVLEEVIKNSLPISQMRAIDNWNSLLDINLSYDYDLIVRHNLNTEAFKVESTTTVKTVLLYALYSRVCTLVFGVRKGNELIPLARVDLNGDRSIKEFIIKNSKRGKGSVRLFDRQYIFEISFKEIKESKRYKGRFLAQDVKILNILGDEELENVAYLEDILNK